MSNKHVLFGGDRIGAGGKVKVDQKTFNRSTHNLDRTITTTMAAGTIVPVYQQLGVPGDSMDLEIYVDGMTHPTIGPLFGQYKLQVDAYQVPMRPYLPKMQMNMLNQGMKMDGIKFPLLRLQAWVPELVENIDKVQINKSCIFNYLGIGGLGSANNIIGNESAKVVTRDFNAIPWLAYWDIVKNYYINKQEKVGYVIHNPLVNTVYTTAQVEMENSERVAVIGELENGQPRTGMNVYNNFLCRWTFTGLTTLSLNDLYVTIEVGSTDYTLVKCLDLFDRVVVDRPNQKVTFFGIKAGNPWVSPFGSAFFQYWSINDFSDPTEEAVPQLAEYDPAHIDNMRMRLYENVGASTATIIGDSSDAMETPYNLALKWTVKDGVRRYSKQSTQEGLAVKTYQSDKYQNWLDREIIEGANGISDLTSVTIREDGTFTMDQLNIAQKLYRMFNRIATYGGSINDWQNAVYNVDGAFLTNNPMYIGGKSVELKFQQIISNAGTDTQPLGSLAGRGVIDTGSAKGGNIKVKFREPGFIMIMASLTPRISYSQGNEWWNDLKTIDDLHKPDLDAIQFQNGITDQLAWWDTSIVPTTGAETPGVIEFKSFGKQMAWLNYMTDVDVVKGNFADRSQQAFMVLIRDYEPERTPDGVPGAEYQIADMTTYIDPSKYNHIFADVRLDAQNFWIQVKVKNKARRLMSAKQMPIM